MTGMTRAHVRFLVIGVFILAGSIMLNVPLDFSPSTVVIAPGSSASKIAHDLEDAGVIAHVSPLWLLLRLTGQDGVIHAGAYKFGHPENTFVIMYRLVRADYGLPLVRLTFQEGITSREMAALISESLPSVSEEEFLAVAEPHEGYLFPDTYLFPQSATAASIVATMRDNFAAQTKALSQAIATSSRSFSDIVTMASIIEREAHTEEHRRMISGILWNRIERDMKLQVDAVFGYINSRATYSPSYADLKIDSPYNTYKYKGLPPGPISNPGLSAINAALQPIKSDYLFYLTSRDGVMHYAKTGATHEANRKHL